MSWNICDQDLTADRIRCLPSQETGTCFLQQGVLRLKRCALIGAASFLARDMAESTSCVTLFIPMIINTFRGPAAIEDTVGMSVNVDHNSIFRDRICTGQESNHNHMPQARSCAYLPVSVRYRGCIPVISLTDSFF